MPRGDGTGPIGVGSMTGRGRGFCAGTISKGYGAGFGARGGRRGALSSGWSGGPRVQAEYIYPGDKEILTRREQALQRELDQVRIQLNSLSEENKAQA